MGSHEASKLVSQGFIGLYRLFYQGFMGLTSVQWSYHHYYHFLVLCLVLALAVIPCLTVLLLSSAAGQKWLRQRRDLGWGFGFSGLEWGGWERKAVQFSVCRVPIIFLVKAGDRAQGEGHLAGFL